MGKSLTAILVLVIGFFSSSMNGTEKPFTSESNVKTSKKLKIEIWSDMICPFCYIGKRKFEKALAEFPHNDEVEVVWKSYQLAPEAKTDPGKNINQFLAEHKGIPLEQARRMNNFVTEMAAKEGLEYNFDKAVVVNSLNAHRLSHFAKNYNKQNEIQELLFRSYFTEGKNIDDFTTLLQLASSAGLDSAAFRTVLETDTYTAEVKSDIEEGHQLGLKGVPFFVFNRKQVVSGAQDVKNFKQALEKSFEEWKKEQSQLKP